MVGLGSLGRMILIAAIVVAVVVVAIGIHCSGIILRAVARNVSCLLANVARSSIIEVRISVEIIAKRVVVGSTVVVVGRCIGSIILATIVGLS